MSIQPARILLTGAAGFIGNACGREFLTRGCRVTALVHRRVPRGLDEAEMVTASLSDRRALAGIFADRGPFDAVVNCAGLASDVADARRLMEANCRGVVNLIECMSQAPAARLVHVSTTDVYGLRDFVDADEATPRRNNLRQAYPRSKILAEQAIAAALPASRYVLLRPGVVWGPGDATILPRLVGFLRRSPFIVHFGPWRGRNRWPMAHTGNVARAAFLAATIPQALGHAYNVVDPQVTTVEQYYRWVLRTFLPERAAMKSLSLPMALGWMIGQASSLLSGWLGLDRPLFEPSLYAFYSVSCNLDFSSRRLQELFSRCGEELLTSRQAGGPP